MFFEKLCPKNVEQYISYLKIAMEIEPEMMTAESLDADGIRDRMNDPFYMSTTSILAIEDKTVVGRIEYHFYGCMQDGYRMTYVDWVYVLPEYRHKGIAQKLFKELEKDCRLHGINQYYLIRATNPNAERFYRQFADAELSECPILRKEITPFLI